MTKQQTLELSALFSISVERLFKLLSTAKYIKQWLSPDNSIVIEVLEYDFCIGGQYHIIYNKVDGSSSELQGHFIDIKIPELIHFSWIWKKPDIHADIYSTVVWRLQDCDNKTKLTVTHQTNDNEFYLRHEEGWQATMIRLSKLIVEY